MFDFDSFVYGKIEIHRMDKQKYIRVIASNPGKEYPLVVTKQLEGR